MSVQTPDPHEVMLRMITGYWATQIVRGAAAVALAERLADGPRTAEDIAQDSMLHPGVAFRFLRACATIGLVVSDAEERFATTPLLDTLRADVPGSLRGMAMAQGAPGHWLPWGRFPEVLATGRRQTIEALGAELFDYYAANPSEAADFSRAMSGMTAIVSREFTRVLDTEGISHVVDIGGAEGALLRDLLEANPEMRGTVFDLPSVAPHAQRAIEAARLSGRVDIVGGNFFAEVPAGDLYLLKYILHDWDDESCLKILRNCRKSLTAGGRIAIIEIALGEGGDAGPGALMDLNMMVVAPGGCERTFTQYKALLESAGFGSVRATPTNTPMVVIEAEGDTNR